MRKLRYTTMILGLLTLCANPIAYAISLDFVPPSSSVLLGNTVTVDVVISGVETGMAPSLSTFDIKVLFGPLGLGVDPTDADMDGVIDRVTLDPMAQLDVLGLGGNSVAASLSGPGILNLFALSLDLPDDLNDLQAGSFTLARITFDTLATGVHSLMLSDLPADLILGDANNASLSATVGTGSITVVPRQPGQVPEPGTIALLSTGCLALLGYHWRRRKHAMSSESAHGPDISHG